MAAASNDNDIGAPGGWAKGLPNECRARERDVMWDVMKETMPDFTRVELPLSDHLALRQAAGKVMAAMMRILAICQGPCEDQHATVSQCYGVLWGLRQDLRRRPRMRTRDYGYTNAPPAHPRRKLAKRPAGE